MTGAVPERTCIVTREATAPEALLRFVAGPDGALVPDLKARLPGRGAWVTAEKPLVAEAVRRKAFARALKGPVEVPPDLADRVEALLRERALHALGLAARQGAAVAGFAKVAEAVARGRAALVLAAHDASEDGRAKIARAAARGAEGPLRPCELFSSAELSLALGRANVVHACVAAGRAAASLEFAIARLDRYVNGGANSVHAA